MRSLFVFFSTFFLLSKSYAFAQSSSTEILVSTINSDSPDFVLGKETYPNLRLRLPTQSKMGVDLGIRLHGTAEVQKTTSSTKSDFYARRARFEITTHFSEDSSFTMDLRDDNANRNDSGERTFNLGDAYFTSRKLFETSFLNLKTFRGKVDVSRTETAKSSWLVFYDRPFVADEAAQYVSHNRRAANLQLYGDFRKKVHYSVAIGDGVQSGTFHDASGKTASSIAKQNPMFGGKLIFSPFDGWEENQRTETYFGRGKHASFGVGYFNTSNIQFKATPTASTQTANRQLLNVEASAHYESIFVQAEFFRFFDVIESYSSSSLNHGNSNGWYVTAEYVVPALLFAGPFARYEHWDRFDSNQGYTQKSWMGGINWYLRGNTIRVGTAVQADRFGDKLGSPNQTTFKLTSQLHF